MPRSMKMGTFSDPGDALAIQEEINERAGAVAAYRCQRCFMCNSRNVYSTEGVDVGRNHTWLFGCEDCGWRYFLMKKWLRLELVP